MKNLLLILTLFLIIGCQSDSFNKKWTLTNQKESASEEKKLTREEKEKPEKPFIIYNIGTYNNSEKRFSYYDAKGQKFNFVDKKGKYNIGDTIP